MSDFQKIATKNDIENGSMKTFEIAGKKIAVAHIDGNFFAIDDTCSHAQCSLGEGYIDGQTVICPCHGSTFDIESGKVLSMPATKDITSYPIKVEGNDILVKI
jgi:3-phenylpropionate/trans-cinnamate dioxygenase ferredoxin subunit